MAIVEKLGSTPLSTAVSAGHKAFTSIFRNKPSTAYSEDAYRYPRSYVREAGLLIAYDYVKDVGKGESPDFSKGYYFQFNPQTIQDTKSTIYETRSYAGFPYVDHIWSNGGERSVTFQLFLDDTPGSDVADLRERATIMASGGIMYTTGEGTNFSATRRHPRGILDSVEKIQSFLYPAPLKNTDGTDVATPQFASGGIVELTQFRAPEKAVVTIGALYYSGYVKAAPVTYELFDSDLTPIRGAIDLEFAVDEFKDINKIMNTAKR